MLKNYLLIAVRVLSKQKLYAGLNVFGLAAFSIIAIYLQYELSFDSFHTDADQLYRAIHENDTMYRGSNQYASSPAPLAGMLTDGIPGIASAMTFEPHEALLENDGIQSNENGLWADASFFTVFSFHMITGKPETALSDPSTVVLTTSLAELLFGSDDPIGDQRLS